MDSTTTIRGHIDTGVSACAGCRAALGFDDTDHCRISVVRATAYRPRYYTYCIDCAVRLGIAPDAIRCHRN